MKVTYQLFINYRKDNEGRLVSFLRGFVMGDPMVLAWQGVLEVNAPAPGTQDAETIFHIFNAEHPPGYRDRSMSKGDVVLFTYGDGKQEAYAVESIGFARVPVRYLFHRPQPSEWK